MSDRLKALSTTLVMGLSLAVTWFAFDWNWLDFITYFTVLYLLAGIVYLLTHPAGKSS